MLTAELIDEAAAFLKGRIRRTPVEFSPKLGVWLKLECLQLTGSFKIRGAFFRLSKLSEAEKRDGVVTCSAGNHGKAVAYAARELNLRATICVPRSVDRAKYDAMVAMRADVLVSEFDGYDDTETWARGLAQARAQTFISPFDDYAVMAANGGTTAMEVMEDVPGAKHFIVPVGGGGLSAGFAFEAGRVIGCQHELSPALALSLEAGRAITKLPAVETMAGGVEGGIGALTFEILKSRIERVALVTEEEIGAATRWMLEHHQYLIEPTAAVTVAACLAGKVGKPEGTAVAVISGRNVSADTVKKILSKA